MKKVAAFTLMELLITMMISSIVIGLCYSAYSFTYKEFLLFKKVKQEVVDAMQFNSLLNSEFQNAEKIVYSEHQLLFYFENNNTLSYELNDSLIIRKESEIIDTFHLKATNVKASFLFENDSVPISLINDFSFDAKVLGEAEYFHFTKNYSGETMMNYESSNQ